MVNGLLAMIPWLLGLAAISGFVVACVHHWICRHALDSTTPAVQQLP